MLCSCIKESRIVFRGCLEKCSKLYFLFMLKKKPQKQNIYLGVKRNATSKNKTPNTIRTNC